MRVPHRPLDFGTAARNDDAAIAALWSGGKARVVVIGFPEPLGWQFPNFLVDADNRLVVLSADQAADVIRSRPTTPMLIGLDGDVPWFLLDLRSPEGSPALADWGRFEYTSASARAGAPSAELAFMERVEAMVRWRDRNHHCPTCGGRHEILPDQYLWHCRTCRDVAVPTAAVRTHVLIEDPSRTKILLTAPDTRGAPNFPTLVSDVTQAGETFEDTAIVAARFHVGLEIAGLRYRLAQVEVDRHTTLSVGLSAIATTDELRINHSFEVDNAW